MQLTTAITLTASLSILIGLFLLHRRALNTARAAGIDAGKQQGFAAGLSEKQRQLYAQGYQDGKAEGREMERRELSLSADKLYAQGYQDAIDTAYADDARPTLSA